jgi:hypothetical protein
MAFKRGAFALFLLTVSCGLDLPPSEGVYNVTSDCPGAKSSNGTLTFPNVSNILSIFDVANAADFGFPSSVFGYSLGGKVSSALNNRSCESQVFVKGAKGLIFVCSENSKRLCTITLKQ